MRVEITSLVLLISLSGAAYAGDPTTDDLAPAAGPRTPVTGDYAIAGTAAGTSAEGTSSPAVTPADGLRAKSRRLAKRHTVAERIDQNVRVLARGLDLDAAQQEKLRQILTDQHRQIMALRGSNASEGGDVAGSILAIYDQTKGRIRAILSEDQKIKYSAEVPRDQLAPAQADLQHWLDIRDAANREGQGNDAPRQEAPQ